MSKTYKGYELLKAIADGEIKEGSRFKAEYETFIARDGYLFNEYDGKNQKYANCFELMWDFELIEDEIDIQSIEEIDIDRVIETDDKTGIALLHINKLIKAVKQLDRKIEKIQI